MPIVMMSFLVPADIMQNSPELENEAVALLRVYGSFLPGSAKAFFKKLAIANGWEKLLGMLK